MTKKHFTAIAATLATKKPYHDEGDVNFDAGRYTQWQQDVKAIGYTLVQLNPNFDLAKFWAACGLE